MNKQEPQFHDNTEESRLKDLFSNFSPSPSHSYSVSKSEYQSIRATMGPVTLNNGAVYEGEWSNGKRDGMGT